MLPHFRGLNLVETWLELGCGPGDRGLPQGMGLSPLLCNLVLHRFDLAMRRAQMPMVRYADDFVVMTRCAEQAETARQLAARSLALAGLELHPVKTRVVRCSRRHRFLGQRLPRLGLAQAWAA